MDATEFEWDAKKSASNIRKHGIDFRDAIRIWDGPVIDDIDDRFDYGEDRFSAIGQVGEDILFVVYTIRGDVCRIISARRANRHEQNDYYQEVYDPPPW